MKGNKRTLFFSHTDRLTRIEVEMKGNGSVSIRAERPKTDYVILVRADQIPVLKSISEVCANVSPMTPREDLLRLVKRIGELAIPS